MKVQNGLMAMTSQWMTSSSGMKIWPSTKIILSKFPAWLKANGQVAELEKVDDYTIIFKFAAPSPLFVDFMSMWPKGPFYTGETLLVPSHYMKQFHPDYSDEYDNFDIFDEKLQWRDNAETPVLNPWMPVSVEPGVSMVMERNPYYYVVDQAGNQLPYIDTIEITLVENHEVAMLKVFGGEAEICGRPCKYHDLSNMAAYRQNETTGGYTASLWDGGSGSIPCLGAELEPPRSSQAGGVPHATIPPCFIARIRP